MKTLAKNEKRPPQKGGFIRDVAKLASAAVVSQLIVIGTIPILTRLFDPAAFGLLALFTAATTILGTIACLRYDMAIVLPRSDRQAGALFWLCIVIAAILSMAVAMASWLFGARLLGTLDASTLEPVLWMLPVYILFLGFAMAVNGYNTRARRFGAIARGKIIHSSGSQGLKLLGGALGMATGSMLIVSACLARVIESIYLMSLLSKTQNRPKYSDTSVSRCRAVIRRYRQFPLYGVPTGLIVTFGPRMPAILLVALFSPTIAGLYALTERMLKLPSGIVGSAVGNVYRQRAAVAKHEGNLNKVIEALYPRMLSFGSFPILVLAFFGPDLFGFVLGSEWEEAGRFAALLAPWILLSFCHSPISSTFAILSLQHVNLIWNGLSVLLRGGGLWIGALYQNELIAVGLFGAGAALTIIIQEWIIFRKAQVSIISVLKNLRLPITLLCASGMAIYFVYKYLETSWMVTGIMVLALGVIYYSTIAYFDSLVKQWVVKTFLERFNNS